MERASLADMGSIFDCDTRNAALDFPSCQGVPLLLCFPFAGFVLDIAALLQLFPKQKSLNVCIHVHEPLMLCQYSKQYMNH